MLRPGSALNATFNLSERQTERFMKSLVTEWFGSSCVGSKIASTSCIDTCSSLLISTVHASL